MVYRCIGKAEKDDFVRHRSCKLAVIKQIWQQSVGVIAAYGAEYHICLRIFKRGKQILRSFFGVSFYVLDTL